MSWWRQWRARLQQQAGRGRDGDETRWVVVDVESSGLDPTNDRLLAVAGLAVRFQEDVPRLQLADSFEVVLRQDEAAEASQVDKPNILLHGIGVGAQRTGTPPQEGLEAFRQWVGGAPIIAYHAAFDRTLIQRYCASFLGRRLDNAWVDLEHVVLLVVPGLPDRSLDAVLSHLGVECPKRHQAAADTFVTAEVLLRIWPLARAQMGGRSDFAAFRRLAGRHQWLPRPGG